MNDGNFQINHCFWNGNPAPITKTQYKTRAEAVKAMNSIPTPKVLHRDGHIYRVIQFPKS